MSTTLSAEFAVLPLEKCEEVATLVGEALRNLESGGTADRTHVALTQLTEAKKIVDDLRNTGVTLAIPLSIEIQQVGA